MMKNQLKLKGITGRFYSRNSYSSHVVCKEKIEDRTDERMEPDGEIESKGSIFATFSGLSVISLRERTARLLL